MKTRQKYKLPTTNGRIARRGFLSQTTALGGETAVATALPGGAAFGVAQKGGTLKLALLGGHTGDTMDPALVIGFKDGR